MQLIRKFTDWILYTSLFAAICAVGLSVGTERLLLNHLPPLFSPLHVFILGCTMVVYNAHFLIKKASVQVSDRYRWTEKNMKWHYVIFILGFLFCSISIFFLSWKILAACVILGVLSFTYTLPLLPFAKARLRENGWVKIITLTLVWTIVTSVLPMLYWDKLLGNYPFEILIRFVFMFTLCVAFDIRDMQTDSKLNIDTIPNIIGVRNSYRLMDTFIFLFAILCFVQFLRYPSYERLIAELLTAFCTKLAIEYSKRHASDKVYLGLIDGMMLLYGCLIALLGHY